jgi:hypothetical protein
MRIASSIVMGFPGSSVADLYHALHGIQGDFPCGLSPAMARFVRDFVTECFTRYRDAYGSVDWRAVAERIDGDATSVQLYLALHAIPPESLPPQLANRIEEGLKSTPYHDEAHNLLMA